MSPPPELLSSRARGIATALARALIAPGPRIRGGDERTALRAAAIVARTAPGAIGRWAAMLDVLEHAPRATRRGARFTSLPVEDARRFLAAWHEGPLAARTFMLALTAPLRVAHFDDPLVYRELGCTHRFESHVAEPPFMRQVVRGQDLAADEDVECDAAVVGTGAGGAVVAKELAARGHAVVMIEEGDYHLRSAFSGGALDAVARFYRDRGVTGSIGNVTIPIPMGRMVGGSTAINTGTCWRTPAWVLSRWVDEFGLSDLAPDRMAPYFERVERELHVARADWKHLGGTARAIARGCDALGYSHRALDRNAPDCDGSGVCDFGCPTDARRSTNVSYVPSALSRGAMLYTGVRAGRVLVENGRCVGVEGRAASGRRLRVRARATVLACGTLLTPTLLQRQRLDRASPHVGKNLSIHPATYVSALFDESIRGYSAIPQGYCVDEFRKEGILLLGATVPIDLAALQFSFVGEQLSAVMNGYDRVATFGVMVEDESRGRVSPGPGGRPLVRYWLGKGERARLARGVEILSRIYLAAGAREVYPAVHGHRVVRDAKDLARLRARAPAASDFLLMAFHPLGTCRMGTSPRAGVVSPEHEVFGTPGLFVADGSVVPSAPGVNPQVTIMALATRAADRIADRLDG